MRAKSSAIRRDFSSHHLSAGENREDLVADFLVKHLPSKFGVSSGIVISHDGVFSNQADLVVVDQQNNAPLHAGSRNKLWPAEAVYALIEVKTALSPRDLGDAISKGQRFKRLTRNFCEAGQAQRTVDTLFVIWAFDSPTGTTLKENLLAALADIPRSEHPDLVIVPDRLVVKAGSYLELAKLGQPGSKYRSQLLEEYGPNLEALIQEPIEMGELADNALLAWYVWFDSWLRQAGSRLTDPVRYLPPDEILGHVV